MIARTWVGVTPAAKADRYWEYLQRTGLPDYRATPGFRGISVLRQVAKGRAQFVLTTYWESMEAIRRFAGDDVDRARYYPEDADYLLDLPPFVEHHEVLAWPGEERQQEGKESPG